MILCINLSCFRCKIVISNTAYSKSIRSLRQLYFLLTKEEDQWDRSRDFTIVVIVIVIGGEVLDSIGLNLHRPSRMHAYIFHEKIALIMRVYKVKEIYAYHLKILNSSMAWEQPWIQDNDRNDWNCWDNDSEGMTEVDAQNQRVKFNLETKGWRGQWSKSWKQDFVCACMYGL